MKPTHSRCAPTLTHGPLTLRALTDATERQRLCRRARCRAEEHFSPSRLVPRYLELYEDMQQA